MRQKTQTFKLPRISDKTSLEYEIFTKAIFYGNKMFQHFCCLISMVDFSNKRTILQVSRISRSQTRKEAAQRGKGIIGRRDCFL